MDFSDMSVVTVETQEGADVRWCYLDDEPDGQYTWSELLMSWPEEGYHHLVDYQPEGEEMPWMRVGPVSSVAKKQWYGGITAEEYVNQARVNGLAVWWMERLSTKQLAEVRAHPAALIWVLMCKSSSIFAIGGSFANLVRDFPKLFSSPQLAFLQMVVGQVKVCVEIPKVKVKELVNPLYLVATGPRPQDIRVFEGDMNSAYETLNVAGQIFLLCKKPTKERKEITVMDAVKAVWLKTTFQYSKTKDYLSMEYYQLQMNTYSSWSFGIHQNQITQLLENIPSDKQIVAPGDGIGLCARAWKGSMPVISGDLVLTNWSEGVKKETLQETMIRGCAPGSVLVLSYVLSLMTEEERQFVNAWPGPIGIIEPRTTLTMQGFQMVGPGVWVRGFPELWYPKITTAEQVMSVDQVLFSENLLSLVEISYLVENPAVKYWMRMRPMGKVRMWRKGEVAPLVVYSLVEWKTIRKEVEGAMVYLVPLGKIWQEEPRRIVLDVKMDLTWRVVYEVPWASDYQMEIKRKSQWVRIEEKLLFTFSYVGEVRLVGNNRMANLLVRKEETFPPQVLLMGIDKQGVIIRTPETLWMIELSSYEGVKLFEFYAQEVKLDLSMYRLPLFEVKKGVSELIQGFRKVRYKVDVDKCPVDWMGIYVTGDLLSKQRSKWKRMK